MLRLLLLLSLLFPFLASAEDSGEQDSTEDNEPKKVTFEEDYPEEDDFRYTILNTENNSGGIFQDLIDNSKNNSGGEVYYYSPMDYNLYIWEAALETASAFPLEQVDSTSGVILTQWYSDENDPSIRAKVDIYVLGEDMRASSLEVSVFKEKKNPEGQWSGTITRSRSESTNLKLLILKRARTLTGQDIMLQSE